MSHNESEIEEKFRERLKHGKKKRAIFFSRDFLLNELFYSFSIEQRNPTIFPFM